MLQQKKLSSNETILGLAYISQGFLSLVRWYESRNFKRLEPSGGTTFLPVMKHLEDVGTISLCLGRHTVPTRAFRVAGFDNCISAMSLLMVFGL